MSEMTGLERLRELGREQEERSWSTVGKVRGRLMGEIARQIEDERLRERLAVERVASEMELHFLGVEGMEDSPVARWARDLRAALGGHVEEVADVATIRKDAYDAYEWVCEHGGLDAVKRRWECLSYYADPVPRSCMEKRLARLQRQIDESHAALRRRNARIGFLVSELNRANHENHEKFMRRAGDYTAFTDEVCKRLAPELRYVEGCSKDVMDAALDALDRRLMPEGMEWLVEAWPRFEDNAPVKFGDVALIDGDADMVEAIQLWIHGKPVIYGDGGSQQFERGECVKRPAPKVLDADGAEIRVGETVYLTGLPTALVVDHIEYEGGGTPNVYFADGTWAYPDQLTHERPDSWERLEEDAEGIRRDIAMYLGDYSQSDFEEPGDSVQYRVVALVRRARALAERRQ